MRNTCLQLLTFADVSDFNRFALLDVSIPSPDLSILLPREESLPKDLPTQQRYHPTTNQSKLPLRRGQEKQLRRDRWAFSLQQNTEIVRSESPTYQKFATIDPASVQLSCSILSEKCDSNTTATSYEGAPPRVPSPLLYHRRSNEASSEPMSSDFTPPSQRIYRYSTRESQLPSEDCASFQQEKSLSISGNTSTPLIAARLPLIGEASSRVETTIESALVETDTLPGVSDNRTMSTAECTPPILTTTNTYIFPKRVYKLYCQPSAAWSGPSYTKTQKSWQSTRKLVFPKLSILGQDGSLKSRSDLSDTDSGNSIICYHEASLKTSLPTPPPELFDSRCRSSTQDSFDSKFNVNTATKQTEPAIMGHADVQHYSDCPSGVGDPSTAAQELTPKGMMSAQTEDDGWAGDTIAWFSDAYNVQGENSLSNSKHIAAFTQEEADMATKLDEGLTSFDTSHGAEDTSEQSQEVWFDYCTPVGYTDNDTGSAVHVDINGIEIDDDDWIWDDQNDWETIASTPATELDAQLQLGEDEWAW